jgi:hypothetical protein
MRRLVRYTHWRVHAMLRCIKRPERSWLVSTGAEDDSEHDGEARVVQNLANERRSVGNNFGRCTKFLLK